MSNRRQFLKSAATVAAAAATAKLPSAKAQTPSGLGPLYYTPLPLGAILPSGWLASQLNVQGSGLTSVLPQLSVNGSNGNLYYQEISASQWIGGSDPNSERLAYYTDGLVPLAALIPGNTSVPTVWKTWLAEIVKTQQAQGGALGPMTDKDGSFSFWPAMPMLKTLMQWYQYSGDATAKQAIVDYCNYHNASSQSLGTSWAFYRWMDEAYVMEWAFDQWGTSTGADFLGLAQKLATTGYNWAGLFASGYPFTAKYSAATYPGSSYPNVHMQMHGVNNGMALKAAAIQYRLANDVSQRSTFHSAFTNQIEILEEYHLQPSGIFSCDELLAGKEPKQGTELCTIAETLFSLEVGLSAFGDATYADRIEKIAYNPLPGHFTDHMWAHQYDGEANQIYAGTMSSAPWVTDGSSANMYGLKPNLGCCTANYQQAWPKLATNLWMLANSGSMLVATLIAPSVVTTTVSGVAVQMTTATNYPFDGNVTYTINKGSGSYNIAVRIPGWASKNGTAILVNGTQVGSAAAPGQYVKLLGPWAAGDVISMSFDMTPQVLTGYNSSVSFQSGPLVFSYDLGSDFQTTYNYQTPLTTRVSDWVATPASATNYAVAVAPSTVARSTSPVVINGTTPFLESAPPITLSVQAMTCSNWGSTGGASGYANDPPANATTTGSVRTIPLQPYGSAKLRITEFPQT